MPRNALSCLARARITAQQCNERNDRKQQDMITEQQKSNRNRHTFLYFGLFFLQLSTCFRARRRHARIARDARRSRDNSLSSSLAMGKSSSVVRDRRARFTTTHPFVRTIFLSFFCGCFGPLTVDSGTLARGEAMRAHRVLAAASVGARHRYSCDTQRTAYSPRPTSQARQGARDDNVIHISKSSSRSRTVESIAHFPPTSSGEVFKKEQ